jgi:hypothetical protein
MAVEYLHILMAVEYLHILMAVEYLHILMAVDYLYMLLDFATLMVESATAFERNFDSEL